MSEEDEMFTAPDESIRDVLDVLTGWSGTASKLSEKERNKAATDMLNDLLRAQPYMGGDALSSQPYTKYDKAFGDGRVCSCEHPYYRHFDTYANMKPVGCKYCPCSTFEPAENA